MIGIFNLKWTSKSYASAMENKDEISTERNDQNGRGLVAVPSYWGIETAKMKISWSDGSKWPLGLFYGKIYLYLYIPNFHCIYIVI